MRLLSAEPDFEVVGVADSVDDGLEVIGATSPDVVLVDINLPGESGLALVRTLAAAEAQAAADRERAGAAGSPKATPKTMVLSGYDDAAYARAAFDNGAHGFLCKTCSREELVAAIRSLRAGQIVFPAAAISRGGQTDAIRVPPTKRELEVLNRIARGLSNRQIAAELFVSERTIHFHVGNILAKLGSTSRLDALVKARAAGWFID